jgi:hypothetical protein
MEWRRAAGAEYEMTNRTTALPAALIVLALSFCSLAAQAQTKQGAAPASSALPDLVGIRPGMPAQEAYAILKARNLSVRISHGTGADPWLRRQASCHGNARSGD